jgi:hypothetical protein
LAVERATDDAVKSGSRPTDEQARTLRGLLSETIETATTRGMVSIETATKIKATLGEFLPTS